MVFLIWNPPEQGFLSRNFTSAVYSYNAKVLLTHRWENSHVARWRLLVRSITRSPLSEKAIAGSQSVFAYIIDGTGSICWAIGNIAVINIVACSVLSVTWSLTWFYSLIHVDEYLHCYLTYSIWNCAQWSMIAVTQDWPGFRVRSHWRLWLWKRSPKLANFKLTFHPFLQCS